MALLTNLVLAGEIIDVKRVMEGIAHILEQADTRTGHRLVVEHRTLQPWLRLLPFTTDPSKTVEFVQRLPEQHRTPLALEELLDALGYAPGAEVEEAIFGWQKPTRTSTSTGRGWTPRFAAGPDPPPSASSIWREKGRLAAKAA